MGDTREDRVFALLETAAREGHRCPTNPELAAALSSQGDPIASSSVPKIIGRLVRGGRIIVRVYGHNWRDVVIQSGRHAGKTTMAPPSGGEPYIVIDAAERTKRDTASQRHERPRSAKVRGRAFVMRRRRLVCGIPLHGVAFLSGFDTPSLHAQGRQRRSSYFNIPRDIPVIRSYVKIYL